MIKTELKDYQKEQAVFFSKKRKALIFEKPGRGKTLVVLAAFSYLKDTGKLDVLFAATPLSAYEKKVWESECKKHTDLKPVDFETLVSMSSGNVERTDKILKHYNVVYLKHSHIKKYQSFIKALLERTNSVMVVDEMHALKNPNSLLTRLWRNATMNVKALWGMTASPLSKNLEDTYHIINFVKPGVLGDFYTFRDIYCTTIEEVIGRNRNGTLKKNIKITGFSNAELFDMRVSSFVIKGTSSIKPEFHQVPYEMTPAEQTIYRKIAMGVAKSSKDSVPDQDWLERLMSSNDDEKYYMKDITAHSSRFIYLQYAADGIINNKGLIGECNGAKYETALKVIDDVVSRGESILVYFSFHASLEVMHKLIKDRYEDVVLLRSTGKDVLDQSAVTEKKVSLRPHVILCTKASAESVSYYFINNVMMFHYPTAPDTFIQFVGRITRMNTRFKDNLHVWLMMKKNIDMYKLLVLSNKTRQMELVAGEELNVPDVFKEVSFDDRNLKRYKNQLLWNNG